VVRTFAKSLNISKLDVLVNDAAMANNPRGYSTLDKMEMAFEVDYPATWLLTDLLLPQLRAARGRVVNLVSKAFRMACTMSVRKDCLDLTGCPGTGCALPPPVISPPNRSVPLLGIPSTN
jgi:hypothetical protein